MSSVTDDCDAHTTVLLAPVCVSTSIVPSCCVMCIGDMSLAFWLSVVREGSALSQACRDITCLTFAGLGPDMLDDFQYPGNWQW